MIYSAWCLAVKDLRMYFRDRMGLVTSLMVPIAMVTVFGWIMAYAFGGGGGMPRVKLWVVDEDHSARSQQFIATLRDSSMIDCLPRPDGKPIDRAALKQMVRDGDAHHGLVIPAGFGAANGSALTDVEMFRDPGRQMEDRILQFSLIQALLGSGDEKLWKQSLQRWIKAEGASDEELQRFTNVYDTIETTIRTSIDTLVDSGFIEQPTTNASSDNPATTNSPDNSTNSSTDNSVAQNANSNRIDLDELFAMLDKAMPIKNTDIQPPLRPKRVTYQQAQSISGVVVMMMMFSLTNAGALLLAERERGTLKRLLALPMQRESIVLGKFIYVFLTGMIQMIILMVYGELMFKVGLFRDPLTLLLLVVTWVATAGSFGMTIATLSTSAKQGDGLATIIILVMAALGGCWFPVQMMSLPLPLEIASKSTMTYWAMEGFQGMLWNSLTFSDSKILKAVGIQWLWVIALSTTSWFAFRRNYLA